MKKRSPAFLKILAFISLGVIGGMFLRDFIKNKTQAKTEYTDSSSVLGESTENSPTSSPLFSLEGFNNTFKDKIVETKNEVKNVVGSKIAETEKTVLENIQKEVSSLTETQVQSLKIQICRDLGVLPTLTPKP